MGDARRQQETWVKGALYLSLAALLAKGLSALYKIPYQNITGDIGFYVYQQVYPLYGIAFVLGTYGFPIVIAKMVAEHQVLINEGEEHAPLRNRLLSLFGMLFLLHSALGVSVIIFAEAIASIMGDPQLVNAVRWMGLPFFLIPFLAIGRGAFQGLGNSAPTAISQVLEQTMRVLVILGIAWWAMGRSDPYLAGISAGIGAFIGGLASIFLFAVIMKKNENQPIFRGKKQQKSTQIRWKKDMKELLINGFFVSVSALALVIFQFIDSISMFRLLEGSGMSVAEAAREKGIYDRGWPLIQFGAIITTVFSYGVIPVLARAFTRGDQVTVKESGGYAVKVCLVFGGAAAVGMAVIMPSLNAMMFTDRFGTGALQILAFVVLFGALFMTVAALAHAVGKAPLAAAILVGGIPVKLLLNMVLIPPFGMHGAAWSSLLVFALMAAASFILFSNLSLWRPYPFIFWLKWLQCLVVMAIAVWIYQWALSLFLPVGRGSDAVMAMTGAMLGGILYVYLIWKGRLFLKKEWEDVPKLGSLLPYSK